MTRCIVYLWYSEVMKRDRLGEKFIKASEGGGNEIKVEKHCL